MANNQYVNEVIYGNQTLISLKNDTVTPSTLAEGVTAHDASGALIYGEATFGSNPYFDDNITVLLPNSSFIGTTTIVE